MSWNNNKTLEERKPSIEERQANALHNKEKFEQFLWDKRHLFGNNKESLYGEIYYYVADYCITFCYKYPKDSKKTNMSMVIDLTLDSMKFQSLLSDTVDQLFQIKGVVEC